MLSIVALIACAVETPASEEVLAAQLEALSVEASATTGTGTLALTGDDADFVATVGDAAVTVHSPAHSDLSAWADADVTISVQLTDESGFPGGAEIADADGALWVAEAGVSPAFANTRFGEDFATYGGDLGQEQRGDYVVTFAEVVFQTDDGEVTATAGAPVTLTLGGLDFRATVITAYTAEQIPGTPEYDCMGKPDVLSYELVRVVEPTAWTPVVRPDGLSLANVKGCAEE